MCLNQLKLYTNSHYLSTVHSRPFVNVVPCGHCSECRNAKRNEWRLRSYYHAKEMFDANSGFVVFDTLTYDDEYLPHISDHTPYAYGHRQNISCFKRSDVTKFFKRLRIALDRAGYDVKDNFDYFLTGEYGSDKEYIFHGRVRRATKRPHYHVLFYIKFKIDPAIFSKFVSDAWICGRTDGVVYKGLGYFNYKRLFRSNSAFFLNIVGYVAKYAAKQASFTRRINSAIYHIAADRYCGNLDQLKTYEGKVFVKKLRRAVSPFVAVSQGYGLYLLQKYDVDYIVDHCSIPMLMADSRVVNAVPLPMYYKRKLFYDKLLIDSNFVWVPNDLGRVYLSKMLEKSVIKYRDRLQRLDSIVDACCQNSVELKTYHRKIFNSIDLNDFAQYVLMRRGRVSADVPDYRDSFTPSAFDPKCLRPFDALVYPYNTSLDVLRFGYPLVSFNDLGHGEVTKELASDKTSPLRGDYIVDDVVSSSVYFRDNCYFEPQYENLFYYIEKIYSIYNEYKENLAVNDELTKEHLHDVFLND